MLTIEDGKRYLGIMPAVADEAMGAKLVSFYPGNAGTSVPTHLAMILLFRPDTGEPVAVMDARLITEMRTAAVSAAVTNYLAAPDSRVLALLGSGVQARAHLEALAQVRRFEEVRIWSRTAAHAELFAEQHGARATTREAAIRGADVIVTATNALEPVLEGAWLKPGAHVNAVGSPRPDWRELDDRAMANVLVVDFREAVLMESGDVILSRATIYAEAGEIFAGMKEPPAGDHDRVQIGRDGDRGHCDGEAGLRRCVARDYWLRSFSRQSYRSFDIARIPASAAASSGRA